MASTVTQTDIVNAALAELGSTSRINSINDEQSNSARRANAVWNMTLRLLLAEHPWNFAIKRAKLNALAAAPLSKYERQFSLPADLVRWLPPAQGDIDYFEGEVEGEVMLSDAEAPLVLRYIAFVEDVSKWPASFVEAFKYKLAASMAEGEASSQSLRDRMLDQYEYWMTKAKRRDGQATGKRRIHGRVTVRSDWLRARNSPYAGSGR
jgi:hypothetical protein